MKTKIKEIILKGLEFTGNTTARKNGILISLRDGSRLDIGKKNGPNRDGWVAKKIAEVPNGKKILDAGAGQLQYKNLCKHLKYLSQDFCQYSGSGDKKELHDDFSWDTSKIDIVSDITAIPVEDSSFDVVMCTEVFEHIPNAEKAVKECSRILKPGGSLIITAPFCSLTHESPYHFSTGFSRFWYQKILLENNFEIKELQTNGNFFEFLGQEIRRIPSVGKEYAKTNLKWSIFFRISAFIVLLYLKKLSKKDTGSENLLCFGFQVLATKNRVCL